MAKKFTLENNPLFTSEQEEEIKKQDSYRGRKKRADIIRTGAQAGLTKDFTRATFIVNVNTLEEVKNYAYTERLSMKDAVNKLLTGSIEAYKNNGGVLLDRKTKGEGND